ncbi:dihydrofolate reductase [Escherichia coli]|nr:dihydrofolate reductase [Escherichia coli]
MKMIAAVGRNYEIGIANELPWRCSTDLKLFKRLTKNATVVMGRKTMESLKRHCRYGA